MKPLFLLLASALAATAQNTTWPVHSTGLSDIVQWDHYSLLVNGRRTFLWSGEIHYWRIPVPALWRDILEKIKAAGFNGISVYAHWAFHAPNNHTLDFETGAHNFGPILDIAKEIGLYVTMRGGPYVNAETTAGGFALWTVTGAYGALRNDDPRYTAAWTPFMDKINEITNQHQITNGGSILLTQIENEICCQRNSNGSLNLPIVNYMVDLQENVRENGVKIPIIVNAPNMNTRSWSTDYMPGPGEQDIYGLDSYPQCWSCNLAECTGGFGSTAYADHFNLVSPTQPSFLPEFQGGSYRPWGTDACPGNIGPNFVSMYYRHLAAERATMVNLYMLYGGTNWGGLSTNLIATSYDYSAPIEESRLIGDKYYETKLIGLFFRAAKDLVMTDRTPFSTSFTNNNLVGATVLRNPETQAGFYIVRQSNMQATTTVDFTLNVQTKSTGNITVPSFNNHSIRLVGVQSRIVTTDFHFGGNTLVYSTAEVLSHSVVDGKSVLALWLPDGEFGEFSILGGSKKRQVVSGTGGGFHQVGNNLVLSYHQQTTQSVLQFDNFQVILLPRSLAYTFWAPTLSNDPIVEPESVVFVTGPYLVRSLVFSGSQALITGDSTAATTLEVFAPANITTIVWNGKSLRTQRSSYGTLKASIAQPGLDVATLQKSLEFTGWKHSDALPEANAAYDDSNWVVADHTTTPNPTKPSTLPVLYADDYGFHTGVQIFRGRFQGQASAAKINAQGGTASGWSAWLNSDYIGSFPGNVSTASGSLTISFENATLFEDRENVLTVVLDHSGHDQRADALHPRGILSAALVSTTNTTFSKWTLAGNAGGESNIDPVRGNIAEGGLHAERLGWHLPGFDDSKWAARSPEEGITNGTIAFFRTTATLAVPEGYDVALQFILSSPPGSILRARLYINGYQYGRYVPQIGNQVAFPVPPGILNLRGTNTIGLSLWSQTAAGAKVNVEWDVLGVAESSFDPGFDAAELQPGWTEGRLAFAWGNSFLHHAVFKDQAKNRFFYPLPMFVPFLTKRSKLSKRRGGGKSGGGSSGGGGKSSGGTSSSSGGGGRSSSISTGGTTKSASAYGAGGGKSITIPAGQSFAGRSAGGGTRDQVYGTATYGSGYPGVAGRGVAGRGFPFFFWPLSFGGVGGLGTAAYLHSNSEYGRSDNASRPGGRMMTAAFQSSGASATVFRILADNATVVELISDITANCSSSLSSSSATSAAPYNDSSSLPPQPEQASSLLNTFGNKHINLPQVIQYYRASSIALSLDGYNNTADFEAEGTPNTPLPSGIDNTLLTCLNQTIGAAAPLIGSGGQLVPNTSGLLGLVALFWLGSTFM
ncbi:Glycoside hydrolase family 35 protein [Mycena indigotica]|uniref:beta-galactosidase n=1 Tax=Mycena indigotica TaxID=2126181 RepID=A0A8H6SG97_9AGAR|nr:Glycoside hydrolase family 35 protein [Mycena indigotica]KAF7298956.1 Glycoside hydrolase family 35 protein [Mycena indigotica]